MCPVRDVYKRQRRGPKLDEDFWDDLEETLILSDLGAQATMEVIDRLRDQATRRALPDAYAVLDLLADEISGLFAEPDPDPFRMNPVCVLLSLIHIFFEILDEIRDIFPEELRQARIIVRDRQGMIEAAEIDANRILEDAERQAEHLAGEEEVVRLAEQRAQEVIDDAMAREREMRVGAEDYADQIFANLETNLDNLLKNVTRCRQRLNSGMTD